MAQFSHQIDTFVNVLYFEFTNIQTSRGCYELSNARLQHREDQQESAKKCSIVCLDEFEHAYVDRYGECDSENFIMKLCVGRGAK